MNDTGKTIAKNAGVLFTSQLVTWGLTLLLTVFLPRMLGATAIGQLHLAISIWAIVGVVAALGMDTLLVKEIARGPQRTSELFGTTLILSLALHLLGFGIVVVYAQLVGYAAETVQVIYIIGLSNFALQFGDISRAALQGLEQMKYISLADIFAKIFTTIVGLTILFLGQGVLIFGAVLVGSNIVSSTIQIFYLNQLQPLRFKFDWSLAKWMLKGGIPYFLVNVFLTIYVQIDIVVISLLVNEQVVGWYGAADGLFTTLMFVPSIFIMSIFPALSRMHADNSSSLTQLMGKSFDLLMLLSIPIGLGMVAIADPLVTLLFGPEFANSGPVLAIMGIVLILTYQNMLIGRFQISIDRQNTWTIVMAAATVATIPLDLVLIPWCQNTFGNGAIGGALAFVATELGMMIAGLVLMPSGSLGLTNAWTAVRALVAGLGMVAAVWPLRDSFIAIPIVIGIVVYLALIVVLRVVPKEDWRLFGGLAQQVKKRFRPQTAEPVGLEG